MKNSIRQTKRGLFLKTALCLVFMFLLTTCAGQKSDEEIVARINEYNLSLKEFETQLAANLDTDPEFQLDQQAKDAFLDQLIQRELLIQEAMKLKLDRRDRFIRTIERYWQSTLIRDLLELKGVEVEKQTYVSEEEVTGRYQKMRNEDPSLGPIETFREEIMQGLKEEKKTQKLKEWIGLLQKNAKIEINRDLLQGKR